VDEGGLALELICDLFGDVEGWAGGAVGGELGAGEDEQDRFFAEG